MKCPPRIYNLSLSMVALSLIAIGSAVFCEVECGNFHTITPGEAYRSAQLDMDKLAYYIKKYRIKSILNLRGKDPGSTWYIDELNVSAKNNVEHYDISLSAHEEPQERDIESLMDIFMRAPRPLLIHCRAGADRSGLVAAMWKLVFDREPKVEAARQLSIFYGHLMVGKAKAMDDFFQKWNPTFKNRI
jgi:protein tyrosine/serine phosphatase